eukprot:3853998-Heterocapsa_arctica.AAC.1
MVYRHTCMIPRNVPLQNAVECLDNAKNGDPSVSTLMARKAGAIFGKAAPKDIGVGPKNPARRLGKLLKMSKESLQSLFGDDLEDVMA